MVEVPVAPLPAGGFNPLASTLSGRIDQLGCEVDQW